MAQDFRRPYVDALFEVAGSAAAVEKEFGPLQAFAAAQREVPDLGKTLRNPGLPRTRRLALIDAVAGKTGCGVLGRRLLGILLQNRRLAALPELLAAVRKRLDREENLLEARIATARPLDPALTEELRALVTKRTAKTIRVVPVVEPALLGGFVVTVGSARYDASLRRRLERAREALHASSPVRA